MNHNTIKLQAFLAHAGIASRRASEKLITEKRVWVNDKVAHLGQRINPQLDKVTFNDLKISKIITITQPEKFRYFIVNKPVGVVSTANDELNRKTVLSLLPPNIKERLYPVGRLDKDSQGLMLLTNDGQLAQKLTHPKYKIPKTYLVTVKGTPTFKALNHLRHGVKLKDGFTKKTTVSIISKEENETVLQITIHEGRNRQVRRMFQRIGYDTVKLERISFGPLNISLLSNKTYLELDKVIVDQLKNI